jgi:hypothetical protein
VPEASRDPATPPLRGGTGSGHHVPCPRRVCWTLAADGRELAWTEFGDPEGVSVVAFHGSPGSGYDFAGVSETAAGRECGSSR